MYSKFRARVLKILPIPEEECDAFFASEKEFKYLKAKEFFIKENETCREIAFVNKGVLRMYYLSPEGKEINTMFFFENDFATSCPSRSYFMHYTRLHRSYESGSRCWVALRWFQTLACYYQHREERP